MHDSLTAELLRTVIVVFPHLDGVVGAPVVLVHRLQPCSSPVRRPHGLTHAMPRADGEQAACARADTMPPTRPSGYTAAHSQPESSWE